MAESADQTLLHPDLQHWVADSISSDVQQALHLTNEDNKHDPPEEPFHSLYSARELLSGVKAKLDTCPHAMRKLEDHCVLSACVRLQLGLNFVNTEEVGRGEEDLQACVRMMEGEVSKVKSAGVCVQAYNQLGVMWGNRGGQQKALECLLKAKAVYESHVALPPPITETQWLVGESVGEWEREKAFESLHTYTLFYLAQVYGNLGQSKQSAQYCQTTLSRQLETREFDAIEWSLNCATLSQYYLNVEHYPQARHCLACASCVFSQFQTEEEGKAEERMGEKLRQVEADLSRCWSKYCIALLRASKEHQEGAQRDVRRQRLFRYDPLEVADLEAEVSGELVEGYEGAKRVFLLGEKHLNSAKKYYSLEDFASDYVAIIQDHSLLFKLLAFFESDNALQCRMHKRRIDMMSAVLSELNPQHFLVICRQLMFELGETYSAMVDLKIVTASEAPSHHAIGKINKLVNSGIQFYGKFVESFCDPSGQLPDPVDEAFLRPVLCAKLYSARLYSKIVTADSAEQVLNLEQSLSLFQWLVEYHRRHPQPVERVFLDEMAVCGEMAELLPLKIASLK